MKAARRPCASPPRFVGRFEKGVDYLGDPAAFEADAALHAALARRLGPYQLSLHSGSDKLSVYGALARQAGNLLHVKTAGTSYLEALRTAATLDPGLFRAMYGLARDRYEEDRASYHVSASLERAPSPDSLRDTELVSLLDAFDTRQVLHVTFGSVLARHGERLRALLRAHSKVYEANLMSLEHLFDLHSRVSGGDPLIFSSTSRAATCHKPRSPMAARSLTCRWTRGGRSLT